MTRKLSLWILLCVFCLGACSALTGRDTVAKISCPHIYVLKDTDRVARFLPDGNEPSLKNLVYEARTTFGDGECAYKGDKLAVTFAIGAYVQTTDLFKEDIAAPLNEELEMFVGVRDKSGKIISRQIVPVALKSADSKDGEKKGTPLLRAFFKNKLEYDSIYPENLLRISAEANVNIPISSAENSRDYKIYIGFRISESEFAYNRKGYLPNF